ncbi:TRAP transporter small permease subunit [Chelativorans composti]|jgi:TRAP-type mannitol/chloroaromatic compound transport system, small permease component|uniref:TRAP transporter small permease protein n=1 Tax=Chelativorans composti TaxID=768533 RepID=A0ABW5DEH8_9HYPH
MKSLVQGYIRVMDGLAEWIGRFAMCLIYVMIAVLLFDVFSDKALGKVQNWTLETAQFTLAAFYFLAGPKTLKDEGHVRLDLIYSHLSPRGRAIIDSITIWIVIFYLGVLLWGGISSLHYSWITNQRLPSLWAPSLVPIKVLMNVCIALMILQCIAIFFRDVLRIREGDAR